MFNPESQWNRRAIRWAFAGLTIVIAICIATITYEGILAMVGS